MSDHPDRNYPARQPLHHAENRSAILFLTVCTKNRAAILAKPDMHKIIVRTWNLADAYLVGRYVILPDHAHLFVAPNGDAVPSVKNWVRFWKSKISKEVGNSIWQRDCWDRQLRTGDSYSSKWEYVRNNPVRHGLVNRAEDWPYQGELNELIWQNGNWRASETQRQIAGNAAAHAQWIAPP